GIDVAMNESLAHCDVVLPAATHFEYPDLYSSYGHHWLQRAEPVIAPLGESLPNTEILRRLAGRFGFDEPCFRASDAEVMDDAVNPDDARLGGALGFAGAVAGVAGARCRLSAAPAFARIRQAHLLDFGWPAGLAAGAAPL